jgi:hypothetical protein
MTIDELNKWAEDTLSADVAKAASADEIDPAYEAKLVEEIGSLLKEASASREVAVLEEHEAADRHAGNFLLKFCCIAADAAAARGSLD